MRRWSALLALLIVSAIQTLDPGTDRAIPRSPCRLKAYEPDMQITRIRLSDKTSRPHPRHVVPKPLSESRMREICMSGSMSVAP
jgi:hypothetical protein